MRRLAWLSLVLVLALILTFGFAATTIAQKKTLEFCVEFTNSPGLEGMKTWFEDFNASHPNIEVRIRTMGYGNEYLTSVKAALAAGVGIDLFRMFGPSTIGPYADANLLLDLSPYAKKYQWDKKIFSYALESHTYKGKLAAFPGNPETLLLFYNKTQFDKNGWKPPKNWDELSRVCEQIQKAGKIPIAFGTRGFTPANEWWLSCVFSYCAGPEAVYQALTGKIPWTSTPFADSISRIKYMWDKGWLMDKRMYDIGPRDAREGFSRQEALMMMDGSWGVKYFLSMVQDFEFGLVEFPNLGSTKVALPLALGFTVGVNAKTKNPEAAAEFLDWLVDNPRQAVLNGVAYYEFWLPIIKGTPEMLPGTIDRRAGDLYKIFYQAQSSGKFGYTTWTFFPARTQTFMYENLPRVLHGELSIEDYLKQAQSTFEKDYAEGKVMSVPKPNL